MGMENGQIGDAQITASSEYSEPYAAPQEGWTSKPVEGHGYQAQVMYINGFRWILLDTELWQG